MFPFDLTENQAQLAAQPLDAHIFLHGPYGCGKTTVGVARLDYLLQNGVEGSQILVLTPQRTLQQPYRQAFLSSQYAGSQVTFATIGGLARRLTDLFWPLAAQAAGFAHPEAAPIFLTLETAQYYMAHIVRPLIEEEGYFSAISVPRQRIYSQILDNLNKAAGVGFPHTEIGERLSAAWIGDPMQKNVYADAQDCAIRFRNFCLAHNLLDFSLQMEILDNHLWPHPAVQDWLKTSYRHLIYDNLEEDLPRAHDIIRNWLPDFQSALLIYDEGGGHRQFLSADPRSGWDLGAACPREAALTQSFVTPEAIQQLHQALDVVLRTESDPLPEGWRPGLHLIAERFYPSLLDQVARHVQTLLAEGLSPDDIVILAPYLSDSLRFAMQTRLQQLGIPSRTHRPSRALRDEPAVRALLTLAQLAHPHWQKAPLPADLVTTFLFVLQTDLIRARTLADILWKKGQLGDFQQIKPEMQERLTYALGERYTTLRNWLAAYIAEQNYLPLDHFLRRIFGEVLSQPGFGFHEDFDAARSAHNLIESIGKFRRAFAPALTSLPDETPLSPEDLLAGEYLQLLDEGLIAAQYLGDWTEATGSVLIAPAFTFMMMNRPAQIQIWLDPGASGWTERLLQPLTHPYVLSRHWPAGQPWRDEDEVAASRALLSRLVSGLLMRCSGQIVLAITELGESGFEERGELLLLIQQLLQRGQRYD